MKIPNVKKKKIKFLPNEQQELYENEKCSYSFAETFED